MTKLSIVKTVCYNKFEENRRKEDYWLMHGEDFSEVAREVEHFFGDNIEEFTIIPLEEGPLWLPEVIAKGIRSFFMDNFSYNVDAEEDF